MDWLPRTSFNSDIVESAPSQQRMQPWIRMLLGKNRPWRTGMNFARRCWGNTDMRPATNGAPFFRTESDNFTIRKLCIASLIRRMICPRSRWRHWRMARFEQSLAEPSGKSLSEFRRP